MKFVILAALAVFTASTAHAHDSTSLVCDNGSMLLHVFEHRTAEDRATDVTVIYGGYIFTGAIDEGKDAVLEPIGQYARAGNSFSGVITVDYARNKVKVVNGALNLEGEKIPVAAKFSCKEMK